MFAELVNDTFTVADDCFLDVYKVVDDVLLLNHITCDNEEVSFASLIDLGFTE